MGEPPDGFYKLSRKQTTTKFKLDSSVYRKIFRTLAVWKSTKNNNRKMEHHYST